MSTKHKILLVDDDEDFVRSMTDLLEAHGHTIISAHDGESGLELARREHPDLMVLDVMMATKTEGFEVARKIPSCPELRDMPVLLVTGIRAEMRLGFRFEPNETWLPVTRIMEKPIDPAAFVATVSELLRRRGEMDWKHGVQRQVRNVLMHKETDLHTVEPAISVFEAVRIMDKLRIGALLVVDRGRLMGLCTTRDCLMGVILNERSAKSTTVSEVMTRDVTTVTPESTVEECMSLMTHKRVRHLPVLDGEKLIGIVSIGDIVRAALAEKNFMIEQLEMYITTG